MKGIKLLGVMLCVCAAGCVRTGGTAPVTDFSAAFTADYRGQALGGSLTYSRQGRMNLRLATPDSLDGLSVGYSGTELRLSCEGLQCTADEAYLPASSFPAVLKEALDALSRAAENGQLRLTDGTAEADGWRFTLDAEGFPQTLCGGDTTVTLTRQSAL